MDIVVVALRTHHYWDYHFAVRGDECFGARTKFALKGEDPAQGPRLRGRLTPTFTVPDAVDWVWTHERRTPLEPEGGCVFVIVQPPPEGSNGIYPLEDDVGSDVIDPLLTLRDQLDERGTLDEPLPAWLEGSPAARFFARR